VAEHTGQESLWKGPQLPRPVRKLVLEARFCAGIGTSLNWYKRESPPIIGGTVSVAERKVSGQLYIPLPDFNCSV